MSAIVRPVWFIVGASSGFGKAIALEALKRGHKVIGTARDSSKLSAITESGGQVLDLDVTADNATIQAAVDKAVALYGKITHVANAAGYVLEGSIEESSPEEVYAQFNTNVFGTINLTRAVLPHLRAQSAGVIANFGSLGSWRGIPAVGLYASTKWAVSGLTESLRLEVKDFGIDVTIIEPGYFRTEFLNEGRRFRTAHRLPAYDETAAGKARALLDRANNNQLGDVEKGAKVIVDVLTKSGTAEGREIPARVVLGTDCLATIRDKVSTTLELLKDWEPIFASTDHDNYTPY